MAEPRVRRRPVRLRARQASNASLRKIGYANGASDGSILIVDGLALGGTLTGTISLATRYQLRGAFSRTASTVGATTKSFSAAGFAAGQLVWISGVNGPRMIDSISLDGKTLTLSGGPMAPGAADDRHPRPHRRGRDHAHRPELQRHRDQLGQRPTRTDGGSFIADGFVAGQQIIFGGGLAGVFTIARGRRGGRTLTFTTAIGTAGGPVTVLPIGAGPGQPYDNYAPLVIYGDTSQDGVWYGGDPTTQSLHNFGPKPMPHVEGENGHAHDLRATATPATITLLDHAAPSSTSSPTASRSARSSRSARRASAADVGRRRLRHRHEHA